jgi:hypothetical protein
MKRKKSKSGQKMREAMKKAIVLSKTDRLRRDRYMAEQLRLIKEQMRRT